MNKVILTSNLFGVLGTALLFYVSLLPFKAEKEKEKYDIENPDEIDKLRKEKQKTFAILALACYLLAFGLPVVIK